ncbi:MAG: hypothetical protein HY762_00260 [Planctomycetes bacterium]|nr:hypothetical protein [Planctomycetota bacterium]
MPDLHRLKTYPIKERKNLVRIEQFAKLIKPSKEFAAFFDSLPDILGGRDLNRLIDAIVRAHQNKHLVGVGLGAHIIKCGLSTVIIDLMEQGVIKAVALNGAGAIHDYEISLIGATSEDVGETIKNGRFGMAEETAFAFARACREATQKKEGLGRAFGNMIIKDKNKHADYSIMATAAKLNIPCTLHIAIGTDTVHMHPCISGDELGKAALADFHIFTDVICKLNKGVWLNIGSAVILPEVFLKAVAIARNLGHKLQEFTTANLDMIQHYRPRQNVTGRPVSDGINITAQHEIILPLLRLGVLSKL